MFDGNFLAAALATIAIASSAPAVAVDLTSHGDWSALASDRVAGQVGDSLSVLIFESSSATNSAQHVAKKAARASGLFSTGATHTSSAGLNLAGNYDGSAQWGRTDKIVAQISVVVTEILPNGDLRVSGDQTLNVNGERTLIHVRGRVRREDISAANTLLSTRLAEAQIDYNGVGFLSRGARPGLVSRALNRVGLF